MYFIICGIAITPIVRAVATLEPEMAAKTVHAAIVAIANPPGRCLTSVLRRLVEIIDHLSLHHELGHQHEQGKRDQQVAVDMAEGDLAHGRKRLPLVASMMAVEKTDMPANMGMPR